MADELKRCLESEEESVEELAAELSDGLPSQLKTHRVLEGLLGSQAAPVSELVDRALLLALAELDGEGR